MKNEVDPAFFNDQHWLLAGPLLVSTDHRGTADGKPLRVFFSDVSVKVTGSDTWTNAQ